MHRVDWGFEYQAEEYGCYFSNSRELLMDILIGLRIKF